MSQYGDILVKPPSLADRLLQQPQGRQIAHSNERVTMSKACLATLTSLVCLAGLFFTPRITATVRTQDLATNTDQEPTVRRPVEALIDAFNQHDVDAIARCLSEDCTVRYVDNQGQAAVGTRTSAELRTELQGYFQAFPNVTSKPTQWTTIGRFVTFEERVSWTADDTEHSQRCLAVFEVVDGKIKRVWYYPAQQADSSAGMTSKSNPQAASHQPMKSRSRSNHVWSRTIPLFLPPPPARDYSIRL